MTNSTPNDMNEWMDKIDGVVGKDWSAPRSRLYIVANIVSYQKGCQELQKSLDFERAVNERVQEVVKDLLEARMTKPMYIEIDPRVTVI